MNSEDILTFMEIIRLRSISGAANSLYTSQSSVSQRLQNLEKELGCTLIIRGKGLHTLELTPAGEQFIQIANNWLNLYEDMQNIKHREKQQKLSIASVEWINSYMLSQLFSDFAHDVQSIQLKMYTRHSYEVYRMLANHEIDIGFVVRLFQFKGIRAVTLFSEELYLACPRNTFPQGKIINPTELNPHEELRWNYIEDYSNWHDKWFEPNCAFNLQLDSASMIVNFLGYEGRWSIIPASVVNYFHMREDIAFHRISPAPPKVVCYKLEHLHPRDSRLVSIQKFNEYLDEKRKSLIAQNF